jgi:uncharacterized protein
MKIVIAGGSGYLGRLVAKHFGEQGWTVLTLARGSLVPAGAFERGAPWDGKSLGPWLEEVRGADVWLNLAGRTVNCRYTKKNRREMMSSRVDSTRALGVALAALPAEDRPRVWLNSSTATIYRHAEDRAQDEATGELGKGLSVDIARAWEDAFFASAKANTRMVALRSAMVFGPGSDGVYGAFAGLAKLGLGGAHAGGTQYVSWVHIDDFCAALDFLIAHEDFSGPVNVAAPEPLPNAAFQKALRDSLGVRFGIPTPEWLLELGAILRRTETELLLKSRRVVPGRLLGGGFQFRFPRVEEALANLTKG